MEDERIKERALFLARMCDADLLLKIGKQHGPDYFKALHAGYQITDRIQAALDVSQRLDDSQLLGIFRENPPFQYYLKEFGGFRGKYYFATTEGKVEFKDCSEEVRKSVMVALERYGETAYGFLQAIINKGGEASFFDIIGECEKLTGKSSWNPVLLRRLSVYPFNLVFKTGSRRYPTWTLPSETIPVVAQELAGYRDRNKK